MVIVDVALVLGMAGLILYGTIWLLTRPQDRRRPVPRGQWRTAHYDVDGTTHVVVQKLSPSGGEMFDEHEVAAITIDDPAYDATFLAAMATARERRALFETEE